jgi:hypothetical protein
MSTLRDISELLASIEAPGAFATRRTTSADDLHLEGGPNQVADLEDERAPLGTIINGG